MGQLNRTATTNNVTGENAAITLSGPFGSIKAGSEEGSVYLSGWQGPASAFDGKVLSSNAITDAVSYTAPKMGPVTLSVGMSENASGNLGLGVGGQTTTQRLTSYAVSFAQGPLAIKANFLDYDREDLAATNTKTVVRYAATYDLGVAKIGAGSSVAKRNNGAKVTDVAFGVTVPMGAITVGANSASRKISTDAVATKGTSFAVSYDLSKRTSVSLRQTNWRDGGATRAGKESDTLVLVGHSF
jgi:hypothetical protein